MILHSIIAAVFLIIGGVIGYGIACLMISASIADEYAEQWRPRDRKW